MATIVGASPTATRYRINVSGWEAFVRCGADILLTGQHANLRAEARCPVCDRPIQFRIRQGRVEGLEPPGALLHAAEHHWGGGFAGIECARTHIFDREDCLATWVRGSPGPPGLVTSLQGYLDRCSQGRGAAPGPVTP